MEDLLTAKEVLVNLFAVCFWDEHDCELLAYIGESLMSVLKVAICSGSSAVQRP